MRISSAGNVGIGTQAPITMLHVNGAITSAGGGAYLDGAVNGSNYKVVFADGNGTLVKDNYLLLPQTHIHSALHMQLR